MGTESVFLSLMSCCKNTLSLPGGLWGSAGGGKVSIRGHFHCKELFSQLIPPSQEDIWASLKPRDCTRIETISRFSLSKPGPLALLVALLGHGGLYFGKMERWNGRETKAWGICAQTEPLLIKVPVKEDNGRLIRLNELILTHAYLLTIFHSSLRSLCQTGSAVSQTD